MRVPEDVLMFVGRLLTDWEGAELDLFQEFGVGEAEKRTLDAQIAARHAEWASLITETQPDPSSRQTSPLSPL